MVTERAAGGRESVGVPTVTSTGRGSLGVEWHGTWSPRRENHAVRVAELPPVQRLLLTTDGTMTTALATLLDEPIGVRTLYQDTAVLTDADDELALWAGDTVLERRVLLHGADSGTPLLFAVSRIVASRLPQAARAALTGGAVAIGIVLRAHEIETFRLPLSIGVKPATNEAARHLGGALMCSRRYLVKAGGRPLMSIDEQFPAAGFAARR
jgi:chorismate-pyruvate lyase